MLNGQCHGPLIFIGLSVTNVLHSSVGNLLVRELPLDHQRDGIKWFVKAGNKESQ